MEAAEVGCHSLSSTAEARRLRAREWLESSCIDSFAPVARARLIVAAAGSNEEEKAPAAYIVHSAGGERLLPCHASEIDVADGRRIDWSVAEACSLEVKSTTEVGERVRSTRAGCAGRLAMDDQPESARLPDDGAAACAAVWAVVFMVNIVRIGECGVAEPPASRCRREARATATGRSTEVGLAVAASEDATTSGADCAMWADGVRLVWSSVWPGACECVAASPTPWDIKPLRMRTLDRRPPFDGG